MESLDEFQLLESMIQKSEDSFLRHHHKKHKTNVVNIDSSECHNGDSNNNSQQMEILRGIIVNELNNHQDLSRRDELIIRLCHQLSRALQNHAEMKKSENQIGADLEDMKEQMQQFSFLVHKYKDSIQSTKDVKHSLCQTDQSLSLINFDESLEVFRRQEPMLSNSLSKVFYENNKDFSNKCDAAVMTNGISENSNVNIDKMLIDQMRELEEKFHSERQSYLAENDRLNMVIEENHKTIDELKRELKKSKPPSTVHATINNSNSILDHSTNKDYSRLPGNLQTNNHLLHVLSVIVKTFFDTENDIQKHLETLGLENNSSDNKTEDNILGFPSLEEELLSEITFDLCDDGPDLTPTSIVYSSQTATVGANDIEDDVVLGASRRLRLAVGRVLKILSEIVDRLNKHNLNELLKQKEDLTIELQEEGQRRDALTQHLLDKEKLVHKLEAEKRILDEQLVDYQEIREQYEHCRMKLDEYEQDRDKFLSEKKRFEMEKSTFSKGLPQLEHKLLQENESLNQDIRQLQREKYLLSKKINNFTTDVENLKAEKEQLIETKNAEFEELISQIDSSEKNLNSLKRFVEEQSQEREIEREEFGKEISVLKEKLKDKDKMESKLKTTIRSLESQISLLNDDKAYRDDQIKELSANIKESNMKISDLHLTIRQLENDLLRNTRVEKELRNKMRELSDSLDIKLNDETNWDDLINAISKFAESKNVSHTMNKGEMSGDESLSGGGPRSPLLAEHNSVFRTVKLMDDKICTLNNHIDSLVKINEELKCQLATKEAEIERLKQLNTQIDVLEGNLRETTKSNELLQQEINQNHMKYSELKVKLESSIDLEEFKKVVNDLQTKMSYEKKNYDSVIVKLEQTNRQVSELTEQVDAYKKEIKSYKELLKTYEHDKSLNKNKAELRNKYDKLMAEVNQLNSKLSNKDKTIALLEQNVEILKSKLNTSISEKNIYLEQLQNVSDNNNKIVIYEKNVDKLRLQNKINKDKIDYLELEINNLKRKIDILEKENDFLKMENQKLIKLKQEMNTAMIELEDNVDNGEINANINTNIYMNGFDKMNSISSSNLLMLKVRRLLTQKGALIYQKNYLINVLSSYQRTENDTLALLANFNNSKDIDEDVAEIRGKPKFRSVAYALIALSRMKYLVNIWQCRKRQLLLAKTAHSMSNNHQTLPVPPKKVLSPTKINYTAASSPLHHRKHPLSSQINSTLKDYVDRLHVVHETLGLQTNKL